MNPLKEVFEDVAGAEFGATRGGGRGRGGGRRRTGRGFPRAARRSSNRYTRGIHNKFISGAPKTSSICEAASLVITAFVAY